MSELLERIRGEIRARLAVSEAAVRESERLEAALAALAGVAPHVETPRPSTPRGARARPAVAATSKRAPRGANREAALRAIAERPGISAADLVAATQIKRPVLYALLARLVDQDEIVKQATADGPAGYALASAPSTADLPAGTDASPEAPTIDPVEPRVDGATSADASPEDVVAAEAAGSTDAEPATPAPRTRRRAKPKAEPSAAPAAAAVRPKGVSPAGDEPPALPVHAPSGAAEAVAEQPPAAPAPKPKRRAAKPRAASRPARSKPKPKSAG